MAFFKTKEKKKKTDSSETVSSDVKLSQKKNKDIMNGIDISVEDTVRDELFSNNEDFLITKPDGEVVAVCGILRVEDIGGFGKKNLKNEDVGTLHTYLHNGAISDYVSEELYKKGQIVIIPNPISLSNLLEINCTRKVDYEVVLLDNTLNIEYTGIFKKLEDFESAVENISPLDWVDDYLMNSINEQYEDDSADEDVEVDEEYEAEDEMYESVDPDSINTDEESEQIDDNVENDYVEEDMEETDDDVVADNDVNTVSYDEATPEPSDENIDNELDEDDYDESVIGNMDLDDEENISNDLDANITLDEDIEVDNTNANIDNDTSSSNNFSSTVSEFTPDDVEAAISNKFYSDELVVTVNSKPFDDMFKSSNPLIYLKAEREKGWLNDHLNELTNNANISMLKLHQSNLDKLRKMYITLVNGYLEKLHSELDYHNKDTHYGGIYKKIWDRRYAAQESISDEIRLRQEALDKEYETKKESVAELARKRASDEYDSINKRNHDYQKELISNKVMDEIQSDFNEKLNKLLEAREKEFIDRFHLGESNALKQCEILYNDMLSQEEKAFDEFKAEIQKYREDNKQYEIKRINVLAQELNESEKIKQLNDEHKSHIQALQADFDAKTAQIAAEFNAKAAQLKTDSDKRIEEADKRIRSAEQREQKAESEIKKAELETKQKLDNSNEEKERLQKEVDNWVDRYSKLNATKNAEYESRIAELKNEKDALADQCDNMNNMHKRSNVISSFLVIVIVIAALAIGVIVGSFISLNREEKDAVNALNNQPVQTQLVQQAAPTERVTAAPTTPPSDSNATVAEGNSSTTGA